MSILNLWHIFEVVINSKIERKRRAASQNCNPAINANKFVVVIPLKQFGTGEVSNMMFNPVDGTDIQLILTIQPLHGYCFAAGIEY